MSRRPEGAPKRWAEGGAQDALSRRAAELFNMPPPAPLGAVRREQIARRLADGAVSAHAGLPLLAKATGVVAIAAGITVGVVRYTSTSTPPHQSKAIIVAPSPAAPLAAVPELKPVAAKTDPAPAIPTPSSRARAARGTTKIAGNTPARPSRAPVPTPDGESAPAIPSVSPPPTAPLRTQPLPPLPMERGTAPKAPSAYPSKPESSSYMPPPVTHEEEPMAPLSPRSEPRLLADALASLHAQGDAKGALALLAEHRRRFPNGALRSEARITEVEALLSLDRRSDALRVLDGLVMERMPRGAELGVLRAELRAQVGRCADAIADFDRCASAKGCSPEAQERALFGRASCRGKLGQTAAARADLERYLLRFPRGWRSEAVRRALAEQE
jgi:hypothetical protein